MLKPHSIHLGAVALAAFAFAAAAPLLADEATRQIDRTFAAGPTKLSLLNIAGDVTVTRSAGSDIRVQATVHGEANSQAEAERLAGLITLDVDESAGRVAVKTKYPLDQYRKYSYPRPGGGEKLLWFLEWLDLGGSSAEYDGVKVRVVSGRSSSAPALWADFRIEVPANVAVTVDEIVGELRATGVEGDVRLDIGSGLIETRDGRGALDLDTGSGDVLVLSQQGAIKVDTGSGDVRLEQVDGERVSVDTGSGDVRLVSVRAAVSVDTGSGEVIAESLVAGASLNADTGSGDIRLAGDLSAVTDLDLSTGSGDVTVNALAAPQVRLAISTGSGDITVDLPDTRVTRNDRNDVRVEIGTAAGNGRISTGSGDVRVYTRH